MLKRICQGASLPAACAQFGRASLACGTSLESTSPWRRTGRCWSQVPLQRDNWGKPGIPSSHTLRGNIHPHRMQEELDTRLLPEAEESGHTYRESVHLQHSVCAGIFTPTRGAQGALLQSPTTPRSAVIISRYQRGGWSAERLIELSNTRGKQQQACFSLALQPVSRCGGDRGGTHLQSPREHSPSSLPRCLQGLSCVKMEHPRAVTAHGGQGGQKVSCAES